MVAATLVRAWPAIALLACRATASEPVASGPPPVAAEVLTAGDPRAHGWALWAALNARTRMWRSGMPTPPSVWETWPSSDAVLGIPERGPRPLRPFRVGAALVTEQLPLTFAVAFDPIAADFVRTHRLGSRAELARLRDAHRPMPEFPRGAIAIKPVWFALADHGLTAMPVWDGGAGPDEHGNPDRSWTRVVAITTNEEKLPDDATAEVEFAGHRVTAHEVRLYDFIHRGSQILVGMHVTTKELPDWVWATYWWHDRPNDGPFAAGRPENVYHPANNYLMDVAYTADAPSFNPWLEARFPSGQHSNCVSCHQRAAFGVADYLPVTQGRTAADDPYFASHLATDFVWSLALEAR